MDLIGCLPLIFVIPGLVPGTNTTAGAAIGPRHKAGDDERVCPGIGSIVHPIALAPLPRVASQQIRALCSGIRSDPVQPRVALPAANPPDHGYKRHRLPPLPVQDPHDFL